MVNKEKKFPRLLGVGITNSITLIRFLGIYFLISSFLSGNLLQTAILSGMIGTTDLLDGMCARKLNGATNFGKIFDATTDKLFSITLLALLSILEPLFLLNFIGELIIGSINSYARYKHCKAETIFIGKVKSATLFASMSISFALTHINSPYLLSLIATGNFVFQNYVAKKYYQVYKQEKKKQQIYSYQQINLEETKKLSKNLCHNIHKSYQPDLILFIAKGGYTLAKEAKQEFHVPIVDIKCSSIDKNFYKLILPYLPESLKRWLRTDNVLLKNKNKKFNKKIIVQKKHWKLYKQRKHLLIVDDTIETGKTMNHILPTIQNHFKNAEIKTASLTNFSDSKIDYSPYQNTILAGPWAMDSKDYKTYLKEYKQYLIQKEKKIKQLEYIEKTLLKHKTLKGSYQDSYKVLEYSKIKTKN